MNCNVVKVQIETANHSQEEDVLMGTINYIIKVEDAKMAQIKKALESANIKVISIIDIYKSGEEGQAKEGGAKEKE